MLSVIRVYVAVYVVPHVYTHPVVCLCSARMSRDFPARTMVKSSSLIDLSSPVHGREATSPSLTIVRGDGVD